MLNNGTKGGHRGTGPGVHVDEATGNVVVTPTVPATPTPTTPSPAPPGAAPKRDQKMDYRISEYETYYQPAVQEYGARIERDALTAFQRERALALQGLGYRQSAGYGDSGLYQAAEVALGRAATARAGDIAGESEKFERAAFLAYMDREDNQAFQLQSMQMAYEYQRRLAEMNEPSWWEGLASLVGFSFGSKPEEAMQAASLFSGGIG